MVKILVVEDYKSLRLLYKKELEQDGYQVVTAGNAAEGIEALETESPQVVVLDIRMPGMARLHAMGRMFDGDSKVRIVLNSDSSSYKDNVLSWATDACVIKSSDTGELRAKIRQVLEARHAPVADHRAVREFSRTARQDIHA